MDQNKDLLFLKPCRRASTNPSPASTNHTEIPDNAENTEPMSFSDLGLSELTVETCEKLGMLTPRRVQQHCIPKVLEGRHVIGIDATGSGKTAAFALPILDRLASHPSDDEFVFALVLTPTRDLAAQLHYHFNFLGSWICLRTALIVSGLSISMQKGMLAARPNLVIATPQMLKALLQDDPEIAPIFAKIKFLVLDEADRLLDVGFQDELKLIFQCLPENRQDLLFSATKTSNLHKFCESYQDKPYAFEGGGSKLLGNFKPTMMMIDQMSKMGLFIDMFTFYGFGADFVRANFKKTGNPVYLQLQMTEKVPTASESSILGGIYNTTEHDTTVRIVVFYRNEFTNAIQNFCFPLTDSHQLPEKVRLSANAILQYPSAQLKDRVAAWMVDKKSAYAEDLVQHPNIVVPLPSEWKCSQCDEKSNLWLNLTDGVILCGRKNADGSGGNNHALQHYEKTKHPLVVNLSTITADLKEADVFSYPEDENVFDPNLETHLKFLGIDYSSLKKTSMTTVEKELGQNRNFEWNRLLKCGPEVEPLPEHAYDFGTGLINIGNSSYLAAVLQVAFSTLGFRTVYWQNNYYMCERLKKISDPTKDFRIQMAKLARGLGGFGYTVPLFQNVDAAGTSAPYAVQKGLSPQMFKTLVAADHPEFSSMRQQDAFEFFLHLMNQVVNDKDGLNPGLGYRIGIQNRIVCSSGKVAYNNSYEYALSLNIPLQEAINNVEGLPRVPLKACLKDFITPKEINDYYSTALHAKTNATKSTGLMTFPYTLVLHMLRFDGCQKKLDVSVDVPDILDINFMRMDGHQPGEELLPVEDDDSEPFEMLDLETGPGRYKLKGFVSHIGNSPHCGQYVAHVLNFKHQWVLFNDNVVGIVQDPPIDKGYIYFFESME